MNLRMIGLVSAIALTACNNAKTNRSQPTTPKSTVSAPILSATAGSGVIAKPTTQALQGTLKIHGTNVGSYSHLYLQLDDVVVTANGQQLPVTVNGAFFDLADTSRNWSLGTVAIPQGATALQVSLQLDEYGAFQTTGSDGEVRSDHKALTFEVPAASVQSGSSALELDLSRSLVEVSPERVNLVPQYRVFF